MPTKAQVKRAATRGVLPRIGKGKATVVEYFGGKLHLQPQLDVDDVALRFKEIGGRLEDLQPVLQEWADYITGVHIPSAMATEGRSTGRKWAKLSPRYAAWKKRNYPGRTLLVLTGAMSGGWGSQVNKRSMRITNTRTYWVHHQYGAGNMPARPLIRLTKSDYKELTVLMQSYLAQFGSNS